MVSAAYPHPLGADAGLRVRRAAAADRLPRRAAGAGAGRDPARAAWRKLGAKGEKLVRYPGLKEEYYLAGFEPDPAVLDELGLDREKVLVVVRPPPETSEYHARNDLYGATIERLGGGAEAQAVVIPRTERRARRCARSAPPT